ncbi:MAG TPA: IS5 family transposase [Reyranella sp.]|nr:IS5 family transposase [Reyranella sp.]
MRRRRKVGQLGFEDIPVGRRGNGTNDALNEIDGLVDWAGLERLLSQVHSSSRGEPAYPPLVMFKVLLLQRWHALSDPGMEAALSDRLSFMRFAGLSLSDETPDHSTIWRFRQKLIEGGLAEKLFAEVVDQLSRRGILLKQGTLIDASLVTSAAHRPRLDEPRQSPVDPDARFGTTNERGRFTFGYKAHVAVDQGTGLVRAQALTPANVQDVDVAADLIAADAGTVYADRAYDAQRLRQHLAEKGLGDGLMRRGGRFRPLDQAAIDRNHALIPVRRNVERLFGTMKRSYRMGRMRAYSLARNAVDLCLFGIAFNLRRWHRIVTT